MSIKKPSLYLFSIILFLGHISPGFALGLGKITSNSTINQPLYAEITVFGIKSFDNNQVFVSLASPEEHKEAGFKNYFQNHNLKFNIELDNERKVIIITTQKSVREPFINFLLNVQTPTSKTLREYKVLLDPPGLN